jgi:hypothetical protein
MNRSSRSIKRQFGAISGLIFIGVLVFDTLALAELRPWPKSLAADCRRSGAAYYAANYDGAPVSYRRETLPWKGTFSTQLSHQNLPFTKNPRPMSVLSRRVYRWDLNQVVDSGYGTVLFFNIAVYEQTSNGQDLFDRPGAYFQARLKRGQNVLASVEGEAKLNAQGELIIETPWLYNTELLNYIDTNEGIGSLTDYLELGRENRSLSLSERVGRLLDLAKALGDGKGFIERFEIRCVIPTRQEAAISPPGSSQAPQPSKSSAPSPANGSLTKPAVSIGTTGAQAPRR